MLKDRTSLFERDGKILRLVIDPGVLRAFLEVRSYRHGARSLETITAMSTLHDKSRYERSALPAADQLDAHVDAREFLAIVERYVPEGALLDAAGGGDAHRVLRRDAGAGARLGRHARVPRDHPLLAPVRRPPAHARDTLPALVDFDESSRTISRSRTAARPATCRTSSPCWAYVLRQDAPAGARRPIRIDPTDPRVELLAKPRARALGRPQGQDRLALRRLGATTSRSCTLHRAVGEAARRTRRSRTGCSFGRSPTSSLRPG
jgi:hypothetical protein